MDTVRVDVVYRPLRIAWAIRSDDLVSFRRVVRLSHALWGGRFNPIVFADRPAEAKRLVELFRADRVQPEGSSPEVRAYAESYRHLTSRFDSDSLFRGERDEHPTALVLDVQNTLAYLRRQRALDDLVKLEFKTFIWDESDPLADPFLIMLGASPRTDECPIDYDTIVSGALLAFQAPLRSNEPVPVQILDHPSLAYLSRHALERNSSSWGGWDQPGFYVGDAADLDDLVTFWNLRAADIGLHFIELNHFDRYRDIMPEYERRVLASLAHLEEPWRHLGIWSRRVHSERARELFSGRHISLHGVSEHAWNGMNIRVPTMALGEASALGVISRDSGKTRVSFALTDKPFSDDVWFHDQHLVASIGTIGGTYGQNETFAPPYVPELNEFLGRTMHFDPDRLRVEPGRVGLVIGASDRDAFLTALSAQQFFAGVFRQANIIGSASPGGLIAQQLITQLGGVDGARVFKIPGVRRLIKQHGPAASFTRNGALQLIGGQDPDNPAARFADHEQLFIEPRKEARLTPPMVFAYMVDKGLFRIGADLKCPFCQLTGWIALDALKQRNVCEYCGNEFDSTRQLIAGDWAYRRSGLLGLERNVQGAIPVVLTLQQLVLNLGGMGQNNLYLQSYELRGVDEGAFPLCEVDFLMVTPGRLRGKPALLIGECKDRGIEIDANDVANMRRVAGVLPAERFDVYYVLAKLAEFTEAEIALAAGLNDEYHTRAILLSARELEPYHIYDRSTDETVKKSYASGAEDLARITRHLYWPRAQTPPAGSAPGGATANGSPPPMSPRNA